MKKWFQKHSRKIIAFLVLVLLVYGAGRLYFFVTDGFSLGNIVSDRGFDPRFETHPLDEEGQKQLETLLKQRFKYLGKGCQSYVFESEDGQYVLKFFKFQRFRPQRGFDYFGFIPAAERYRLQKIEKKRGKLEKLYRSWQIAYEELPEEAGIIYVHLNPTDHIQGKLVIIDKVGLKHVLDPNRMEFLVQRKATMLCPTLDRLMRQGHEDEAKALLTRLLGQIVDEYQRGLADHDHALMQNTGVYAGAPFHIDVGQFAYEETMKDPLVYKGELFNKTYKFRSWLQRRHPGLSRHFDAELLSIIGPDMHDMKAYTGKAKD